MLKNQDDPHPCIGVLLMSTPCITVYADEMVANSIGGETIRAKRRRLSKKTRQIADGKKIQMGAGMHMRTAPTR